MNARRPGLALAALCPLISVPGLRAQAPAADPPTQPEAVMSFEDYEPRSTLVVPEHPLTRARYPFVNVHNHQDEAPEMTPEEAAEPSWHSSSPEMNRPTHLSLLVTSQSKRSPLSGRLPAGPFFGSATGTYHSFDFVGIGSSASANLSMARGKLSAACATLSVARGNLSAAQGNVSAAQGNLSA